MANQRMQEDNIKYVVSAETAKAQQEIHKLSQETKDLAKEERARRQAMIELEAQGKKNTTEYKNLQKEAKGLSDKIKDNNKQIGELTKKVDINGMSMVQLKKRAKELQTQLDNTSKALSPEEYTKTERALNQVKNRMGELKTNGQTVKEEIGGTSSMMSKLALAAKAFIAVKLIGYLKDLISGVYETRKEFAQYEAVLRNTLGSSDKAAAAMKWLQKLATDTPYSLKELTEGYIKLINRGITPTTEQMMNMGDIASSQGKTFDQFVEALLDAMTGENERLKEFGIRANAQGDKVKYTFKGVTTEVAKTDDAIVNYILSLGKLQGVQGSMITQMEELGGMESNIGDSIDNLFNRIGKKLEPFFKNIMSKVSTMIDGITKSFTPLNESFEDHLDKVTKLQQTLPGLANRYNELKSKTKLSKDEQAELNKVVSAVADVVPSAISQWDKYGNAIGLNTKRVYEYMEAEKYRLRFEQKELIKSSRIQMEEAKRTMEAAQKVIDNKGYNVKNGLEQSSFVALSEEELQKYRKMAAEAGESLKSAEATFRAYYGNDVDKLINERVATEKYASVARTNFSKLNQKQLKEWIDNEKNASNRYREIAQEIYESREKTNGSGGNKDKSDPYAVALKRLEASNDAQVNEIRLAGREKQQSEYEIETQVLKQEESYYNKRISLLQKFSESAKKADKRAEYSKQVVDAKTKLMDIEVQKEKQNIAELQRLRDADLAKEDEVSKAIQLNLSDRLATQQISQEEYNALMLSADTASAETRLAIQQRYFNDVSDLEIKNAKLKEDTVNAANKSVTDSEQTAAAARVKAMQYLNNLVKSFKEEFKLTTVDEDLAQQMKVLDAAYQARKEMAEKSNLDTTELDQAYNRAKEQLELEHQQKIASIRDQYGLSTEQERYQLQLANLKGALDQQLLTQEEYEQAVKNLKRDSYKKQFDYYSGLFSGAVNALQQAEMDNIDAKYDGEIEAAKGNAEEVERLENEKEKKKLEVQKKYADINFAIKASQIVADTAVSIMKAYADLGPIAGTVAAALLGITGVAQLLSANAERQKVKNMTVNGSSSSKSSGARVATGRESGGYVDVEREQDGKRFNAKYDPSKRGYIDRPTVIVGEGPAGQSKEWVAGNAAVSNPTVAPILDMIDSSQRAGTIRTLDLNAAMKARMAGYATGGSISASGSGTPAPANAGSSLSPKSVEALTDAINNLVNNGVPASVVLSDLERKQQMLNRSREIGSKR